MRKIKHIGLITAFLSEGTALLGKGNWNFTEGLFFRKLKLNSEKFILCVVSGMGKESALKGVQFLLRHSVTEILNMGVAAGLSPTLRVGDVVCASSVENQEGLNVSPDYKKVDFSLSGFDNKFTNLWTGKFLTVYSPLLTRKEKINTYDKTGAIAAEMESLWVGLEASSHGVPFLAFRSISDGVDNSLVFDPSTVIDNFGRLKLREFLQMIRAEPRLLLALPELALNYSKALKELRYTWQKLLILL